MNALVTSISRKVPMVRAAREALAEIGQGGKLLGGDSDPRAVARAFVDEFWEMPRTDELTTGALVRFCSEHRVRWVIPSRDGELPQFAGWSEELSSSGVRVMVGTPESVEACCDKAAFSERLREIPEIVPARSRLRPGSGGRWVIKERYGAGSRGALLDLSADEALRRVPEFFSPIFQPFIQGKEYSVDLYRSRAGRVWGCVVRSRDLVVGGESQVTTVVRHIGLEALCCRASELLDVSGHAVFQAIEDGAGGLHLLECNARFGGASTLAVAAGLNSFGWFFRETLEAGFAPSAFVRGAPGLKLTRYPVDRIELSAGPDDESRPGE